jgi:hypothetical protein
LQYVNKDGQAENYNAQKIFSYLRFTDKQKLLFICNFDLEKSYKTELNIPRLAYDMMKVNPFDKISFKGIFGNSLHKHIEADEPLKFEIQKNSFLVFEISTNQ